VANAATVKRAAIYIRKSQVYKGVRHISPEMQRDACIRWCEDDGYAYEVFADVEGHSSGGTDKRPGYQELKRRLKEFNAVVIHSLSRLSRNKRDYFSFLEDLRKHNIDFVCITQKIDTTTPYGRAFLGMAVVWSELERELDAERATQTIAVKQNRGEHCGTIPLGYDREHGVLRPAADAREIKLVRLIFDLYGTGQYSDVSLARHLNVAGYRGKNGIEITDKAIRTILNNHELYLGYIKRHWRRPDRELIKGSHPPLITNAQIQLSQSIRSRNTLTKLREGRQKKAAEHRTYLLAGIVRCAYCGGPMWGGATSSNRGRRYRCRHIGVEQCPQRMVTAEVVERQVLELLRWFDIPVSAHEDVAKAVISLCRATGGDDDYVQAETARRELALRRQRTLEMYRDGLCNKAFRDKSLGDISEEEGRWHYATSTPGMSPMQALELVRGFAAAVQESNPEAQREVVERVFTRIAIRDDQVVDVDIYPVYAEAFRWYLRPRADSNRRSPP
jgi:site-specific DNA recombinase